MTVADLIAELQKFAGHLPVAGTMTLTEEGEDGLDRTWPHTSGVTEATFQGRYVELWCDGLDPTSPR